MKNLYIQFALALTALILAFVGTKLVILPIVLLICMNAYVFLKLKKEQKRIKEERNDDIDFLTKLYNRAYFIRSIDKLVKAKKRFSVFNIDLNNFKSINDIYGHDLGDVVLTEIGKRFKAIDNNKAIFARFGGDEFAVLFKDVKSDKINELGNQINGALEPLLVVSESEFHITASIGVARYPIDSTEPKDLLKLADIAMYHAKKSSLLGHFLISDELSKELKKRIKIGELLKQMDMDDDLELEYHPRFDFKSGEILGVEALVRWHHKELGIIEPADFIPIAEEMDIVKDITRWVFINSLHQIKTWNETYGKDLVMSINVSNSCIHNRIFFKNLKFMLDNFKIKPQWLAVELTELSLSASPIYMKELLVLINELGVQTYLDDFGTGCTSLSNLKAFKVGKIKIDNEYIHALSVDSEKRAIVTSMILLAHGMGMKAIAEGVENEKQYKILKELGCDSFHGFLKEKPLSASEFEYRYLKFEEK